MKRILFVVVMVMILAVMTGCGSEKKTGEIDAKASEVPATLEEIEIAAKEEGSVVSVGMPDTWANWKDTWDDMLSVYNIDHTDTDMSSAEEIAKMEAEKDKPTTDMGDVGMAFAPVAVEKGITTAYKTSYWDEVPEWAKDEDGHWMLAYTGTIAFIVNKNLVEDVPTSWADLLEGDYQVAVGDVGKAAQANNALVACALAHGGDESNLQPAIDYFAQLAKSGRLSTVNPSIANIESGEVEVALILDFNALNYKDKLGRDDYFVCIPEEGSVIGGYATIINKYAPHPNAAKLAREYIFSDEGQINLAKGYARPIRTNVELPEEIKALMIPNEQYKNVQPIKDFEAMNAATETLPEVWQSQVLIHLN